MSGKKRRSNLAVGVKPGERAPEFEAKDQNGNDVSLKSFLGHPVVLYFYPKDDTPGCTSEACSFRDSMTTLQDRGIAVLGVSVDSEESHSKFASKYRLNFPLLSDTDRSIVRTYGVRNAIDVARRVTYIIGPDGIIKHVFSHVNVKSHADEVLRKIEELRLA